MARRSRLIRRLEEIAARMEPEAAAAFRAAVQEIRQNVNLSAVIARFEAGDVAGTIAAMGIDPLAYAPMVDAIERAYGLAGSAVAQSVSAAAGARLVFRFDARNPAAELMLRQRSSQLVTRIVEDQREAVRIGLTEGIARGANPRTTALDIVGRVNRQTGRREGGILGLSSPQQRYVANAAAELSSGEPAALRSYLGRERRDRRFDRVVTRAINSGERIPAVTRRRMLGRYSDRLLQLRGEAIARTETLQALNVASDDAMDQLIATGRVQASQVTKTWRTAADGRVRDSHGHLNGDTVAKGERFANGLRYPHEPGAPASEVVNCRCQVEHNVDFLAGLEEDDD